MFGQEMKKMIKNPISLVAVISSVLLLLSGTVYRSGITAEEYSVFDFMLSKDRKALLRESGLQSYDIILRGVGGYYHMFLPILASVPFTAVMCGEKKNNNTRFEIVRVGKKRYAWGKGFASAVTGGCIALTAYLIFCGVVLMIFPHGISEINRIPNEYLIEKNTICRFMMNHMSLAGMGLLKTGRMFLYGAFRAMPAYGMSVVIRNRYLLLTVPFTFYFLLEKVAEKQGVFFWHELLPNRLGDLYELQFGKLLLIFGGTVLILLAFYRIGLERKCDCGDS